MAKKKKKRKSSGQDLLRQKRLAKLLLDDAGRTPVGKLMLQAGYAKGYAKNPQDFKKTVSWQELMEQHFPDSAIAKAEGVQLNASVIQNYVFSALLSDEEIKEVLAQVQGCVFLRIQRTTTSARAYFTTPDNNSIGKSLDRIYKIKGKYASDKNDDNLNKAIQEMAGKLAQKLP